MPPARAMTVSDWALLTVLSVLWGGSFFFNKVAVLELPPITVAAGRIGFGALLLVAMAKATGEALPRQASMWGALALMGLFNSVLPFSLIIWSQQHVTSGLASILIATTPLFTVVVAHCVTEDDKLTRARAAGLAAGLLGVIIMTGPDLLRDFGAHVLAQFALLLAAMFYATSAVYGRRFRSMPVVVIAAGQMTAAAVMIVPLMLLIDPPWTLPPPSPAAIGAIAGLAGLSTALGYLIYFRVLARAGATNLLLVNFMIPVSAILLGVAFLGERIEPRQIAGMLLIAVGLAAIDGRPVRWIGSAWPAARTR
ncbi:MAG TPA: DMT family transporter [Xanthobacteraceae bacterium]|nr:DMT family transporter [Xanthobacteraceae bacterium]